MMEKITVVHKPDAETLKNQGVFEWPIWTKEKSEFPWTYADKETCYLLEGQVTVIPDGGQPVEIRNGDFVTFPAGMSCTWKIHRDVRKHYKMG
jgi:uncharacterized cupin superfamily protein